ncbi:MAG: hypothetical protein NVS3B7_06710 [Candidatus Elarobacter sp.]
MLDLASRDIWEGDIYLFLAGDDTAERLLRGDPAKATLATAVRAVRRSSFKPAILRCAPLVRPFPITVFV